MDAYDMEKTDKAVLAQMEAELEADARDQVDLGEVSRLARLERQLASRVEEAEADLKDALRDYRRVAERELPDAMKGIAMVVTEDGLEVRVSETLYASIAKKNLEPACDWLLGNGHGAIVREDVVVPFEMGDTRGDELVQLLEERGFIEFKRALNVNTARVKSLIRELTESGDAADVPLDLFGAYWKKAAKVKRHD